MKPITNNPGDHKNRKHFNKAIRIRNLGHSYGGRPILDNIELDIDSGHFYVLLGKNGSGKSTLFRLIAGFLTNTEGTIELMDRPAKSLSDRERARYLGFLPQHHWPVFPFTVQDVVLTGRAGHIRFLPREVDRNSVNDALSRIGISHLKKRVFTELSGGEQQLVMLARVLAQQPRIILLDEPISHLDLAYQALVMSILRSLASEGFTVFAILHDPNIAMLYADRLVCLKDGRLIEDGTGAAIKPETLQSVYGMGLTSFTFQGKNLVLPYYSVESPNGNAGMKHFR